MWRRLALVSGAVGIVFTACSSGSTASPPAGDTWTAASDAGAGDVGQVEGGPGVVSGGKTLSVSTSQAVTVFSRGDRRYRRQSCGCWRRARCSVTRRAADGCHRVGAHHPRESVQWKDRAPASATAKPVFPSATITVTGQSTTLKATTTLALTVRGASGTLDTSWGTNGIAGALGETGAAATGIAIQATTGLPIVGGYVGNNQFAFARYKADGTLDPSYGSAGKIYMPAPTGSTINGTTTSLVLDAADGALMAAAIGGGTAPGCVARVTAAGLPDAAYGTGGIALMSAPNMNPESLWGMTLDLTGNAIACGFDAIGSGRLYRTGPAGAIDTNWATGGYTDVIIGTKVCYAHTVVRQGGGRLATAGTCKNSGPARGLPSTVCLHGNRRCCLRLRRCLPLLAGRHERLQRSHVPRWNRGAGPDGQVQPLEDRQHRRHGHNFQRDGLRHARARRRRAAERCERGRAPGRRQESSSSEMPSLGAAASWRSRGSEPDGNVDVTFGTGHV